MKKYLILIAVVIAVFLSCKKEDNAIEADYEISVNESFTLNLESNSSTGYSWLWTNRQSVSIVDTINQSYNQVDTSLIGGAGEELWEFKGIEYGTETIKMEYCRSWEDNSTTQSKEFVVTVK